MPWWKPRGDELIGEAGCVVDDASIEELVGRVVVETHITWERCFWKAPLIDRSRHRLGKVVLARPRHGRSPSLGHLRILLQIRFYGPTPLHLMPPFEHRASSLGPVASRLTWREALGGNKVQFM